MDLGMVKGGVNMGQTHMKFSENSLKKKGNSTTYKWIFDVT